MDKSKIKEIIQEYFDAYNEFNIEKMVALLTDDISFKNTSNGKVILEINGKKSYKHQAESAVPLFEKREMTINKLIFNKDNVDVRLKFKGILGIDVPEDHKKGDKIEDEGRTILKFRDDKIYSIEDINDSS